MTKIRLFWNEHICQTYNVDDLDPWDVHKEGYFRWVVKKPVVVWEVNLKKIDKFVNFFVKSYNFVNKLYLPIGNIQISILRFTQLANI
jgi:hypothetical protein